MLVEVICKGCGHTYLMKLDTVNKLLSPSAEHGYCAIVKDRVGYEVK